MDTVDTVETVEVIENAIADDACPERPIRAAPPAAPTEPPFPESPPASEADELPGLRLASTVLEFAPLDNMLRRVAEWSLTVQLLFDSSEADVAALVESAVEEAVLPL